MIAQTRCVLDPAAAPAAFGDLPDAECAITSVDTDGEHAFYAASIDENGNAGSPMALRVQDRQDAADPRSGLSSPKAVDRPDGRHGDTRTRPIRRPGVDIRGVWRSRYRRPGASHRDLHGG